MGNVRHGEAVEALHELSVDEIGVVVGQMADGPEVRVAGRSSRQGCHLVFRL